MRERENGGDASAQGGEDDQECRRQCAECGGEALEERGTEKFGGSTPPRLKVCDLEKGFEIVSGENMRRLRWPSPTNPLRI